MSGKWWWSSIGAPPPTRDASVVIFSSHRPPWTATTLEQKCASGGKSGRGTDSPQRRKCLEKIMYYGLTANPWPTSDPSNTLATFYQKCTTTGQRLWPTYGRHIIFWNVCHRYWGGRGQTYVCQVCFSSWWFRRSFYLVWKRGGWPTASDGPWEDLTIASCAASPDINHVGSHTEDGSNLPLVHNWRQQGWRPRRSM